MAIFGFIDLWLDGPNCLFDFLAIINFVRQQTMFRKKKKIEKDSEAVNSLNQDLIVHNMPKVSKFSDPSSNVMASGSIYEKKESGQNAPKPTPPKSNFKTVGLIIIGSGVIVIGGLFYLTYHFIIAPTANQNKKPEMTIADSGAATSTPAISPFDTVPATDLSTTTPVAIDLATTTVASTSEVVSTTTDSLFPDTDSEGLNDKEEALLGTSPTMADTDSDGYSDFAEVISGYNPAGSGKISNNGNYTNKTFGYEILYPKSWPIQTLNNDATTIFTAPDNSLIQVSVQDNPDKSGILSWYEESFPNVTVGYDQVRSTYSWEGIMGENGLNFYLTDKKRSNIYVISYISALEGHVAYPNIFQLMINSLFVK